jgi:hypothetical protein
MFVKFVTFNWRDTVLPSVAFTVAGAKVVINDCPNTGRVNRNKPAVKRCLRIGLIFNAEKGMMKKFKFLVKT